MNFEDYLISKKIDSAAFLRSEPDRWNTWHAEFEQVHPNSFTLQKLNLINPLRRKYLLKQELTKANDIPTVQVTDSTVTTPKVASAPGANPKPVVPRPVFKPKPKPN